MRTLVTGGAGFIGGNLVRRLVEDGHEVTVVDDLSTGHLSNLGGRPARFVRGSILDAGVLDDAFRGVDRVIHLAARPSVPRSLLDPVASHDVNVTGTVHVLERARRQDCHVVVASSSSVYGSNPVLPKREDLVAKPVSPYAVSKLAAESYALAYGASFGLPTLAFRFFNVFGPLQAAGHAYAAVVPAFVDAVLADQPVVVHGDGLQTRDFTFVDTVTQVLAAASQRQVVHDGPVNLAFGSRASLLDVLAILRDETGHEPRITHVGVRQGDVRHSQADDTVLRGLFPDVRAVGLQAGLRATVEWFRGTQAGSAAPTTAECVPAAS